MVIKRQIPPPRDIAFRLLPFKRHQDAVCFSTDPESQFIVSLVDGWNDSRVWQASNVPGLVAAGMACRRFPEVFLSLTEDALDKRAVQTAKVIASEIVRLYPIYAGCVGAFLFRWSTSDILVTIGSIDALLWDGKAWYKPTTIGDYWLDPNIYPSDVSRFLGRGELASDSLYASTPDVTRVPFATPVFIVTDGLLQNLEGHSSRGVLSLEELNNFSQKNPPDDPWQFNNNLEEMLRSSGRLQHQEDDITFVCAFPRQNV